MDKAQLREVANGMVANNKGLLAADESTGTIKKRFDDISVTSTADSRRDYRELMFRAPGTADCISGVILYDETIRQNAADGTPLTKVLTDQGIYPGIKVDGGAKALAGHSDEKITEGLDGLRDRLAEYYKLGARFAKWRAVITIGDGIPSAACYEVNAHALARYAALCQEANIVPIVEPEVLMDGDHSIDRCEEVTSTILSMVFEQLRIQGVYLEGMILKPNMIISGKANGNRADAKTVAEATLRVFHRTVPSAVPGIMFLSGGQSPQEATEHLNLMNAGNPNLPWKLSFSYGRALQQEALRAWSGKAENVGAAQAVYLARAKKCSAACDGSYTGG